MCQNGIKFDNSNKGKIVKKEVDGKKLKVEYQELLDKIDTLLENLHK